VRTQKNNVRKKVDQKEMNANRTVLVGGPVVKTNIKSLLDEVFRFVSVGGDFV
jgi:hypothetical protein